MTEKDILQKIRADDFVKNNGKVLRAINIGRPRYNRLESLRSALEPDIDRSQFSDCVNYLSEAGYITLRRIGDKLPASVSDDDIGEIEAKVSAEGIRLLNGKKNDPCIRA